MRYTRIFLAFSIAFIALFAFSSALGVSPSRIDIPFEPNATKTFTFRVFPGATPFLGFSARGDLAQYVTFPKTQAVAIINVPSDRNFEFTVNLPASLPRPGLHDTRIVVTEYPQGFNVGAGAGVSAKVAVELQFWVRQPYPGKYLEVTGFAVGNTQARQAAPITLGVVHRGNETIANASAFFEIFSPEGAKLATLSGGWGTLVSGRSATFDAVWPTGENPPGKYVANATLSYDGTVQQLSTVFKVGAELVEISDISVKDVVRGDIARFQVQAESFWAEDIPGVFVETNVVDVIDGSARSESKKIPAYGTGDFLVFWDTKPNKVGEYPVEVTVHFLGKTRTERAVLRIVEPGLQIPWLLVGGGAAAILLAYLFYRFVLPRARALLARGFRGRGVSGDLEVHGDRAGEAVDFVLHVLNNSGEPIEAGTTFEVFDSQGGGVTSLKADAQKIAGGQAADFSAKLPASKAKAGAFTVSAILSYGGKDAVTERGFSLREEETPPWEKFK